MSEYSSEFEAPIHSVIDVRTVGNQIVRTVIIDGIMQEFVVSRDVYLAGKALEDDEQ